MRYWLSLIDLGVPSDALSFSQTSFMQPLHLAVETPRHQLSASPTLQDRISNPDGRLRGGYEISSPLTYGASQGCTLGFTAITKDGETPGTQVLVTVSHCSHVPFHPDNWPWYQDGGGSFIGREILDPRTFTCRVKKFGFMVLRRCLWADANLLGVDQYQDSIGIALGDIGRTTEKDDCDQCSATIEIDEESPIIRIRSQDGIIVDNEPLHKIGKETGWTYGNVEDTCADRKYEDTDIYIKWVLPPFWWVAGHAGRLSG